MYKLLKLGLYLMKEQQKSSDKSLSKSVAEVGFELSVVEFSSYSQCQRSQSSNGLGHSFFSLAHV